MALKLRVLLQKWKDDSMMKNFYNFLEQYLNLSFAIILIIVVSSFRIFAMKCRGSPSSIKRMTITRKA